MGGAAEVVRAFGAALLPLLNGPSIGYAELRLSALASITAAPEQPTTTVRWSSLDQRRRQRARLVEALEMSSSSSHEAFIEALQGTITSLRDSIDRLNARCRSTRGRRVCLRSRGSVRADDDQNMIAMGVYMLVVFGISAAVRIRFTQGLLVFAPPAWLLVYQLDGTLALMVSATALVVAVGALYNKP